MATEDHAVLIAGDWNVRASGEGFVTRFEVRADYIDVFESHEAGGRACQEYWIQAAELPSFNNAIVSAIEVVRRFDNGPDGRLCEMENFTQPPL